MMGTLDDRNKPVDPFNRRSIDDCSGEEWDAATRAFWNRVEEDPMYSRNEKLFSGNLFDEADDSPAEHDKHEDRYEIEEWLRQEEILDAVVECLGDWDAITYCQGTVLRILMDSQNATNKTAIIVAKRHLDKLSQLVTKTEGVNW